MTQAVLDASAVIALLKGERGARKVADVIANATVSVFNQAEVVSHFINIGAPESEVRMMLGTLPYAVVGADEALGWEAGLLRAVTANAGLSLATASASRSPAGWTRPPIRPTVSGRR